MHAVARVIDEGIGPWKLSEDGSALVRGADAAPGDWPRQSGSWSRQERITVRPERARRIAIVGESVARGFMLDPVVTFADLCRDAVRNTAGTDDLEIVDLAANNLSPAGALRLCQAAIELGSQVIVLYIGNNVLRSTPWLGDTGRGEAAAALRDEGYSGYLAMRRRAITTEATRFTARLRELCVPAGVRVIVVVPATNLLDWQSPWVVPTWLSAPRLRDWTAAKQRVNDLPDHPDNLAETLALARRLVELDGGTTARPLEILGRALVGSGAEDEGLRILDQAVSTGADPARYDRRCPPEVAGQLRLLAEVPGFRVVDVPSRSRERAGVAAFDRSSFLDYCHHTLPSLRLIAEDVSAEILDSLGHGPGIGGAEPVAGEDRLAELAVGYLLAALHNQHWGQPAGIVEHWLREALAADPDTVANLTDYFARSTPDTQFWLQAEQLMGKSDRMYWFLKNFSHQAVLDAEFARRAVHALGYAHGATLRRELEAVWERLAVERLGGVDLLEPYWRERDGPPQAATVCTGETSAVVRYAFIASGEQPLTLDLVVTLGPGLVTGPFEIRLNGEVCHTGTLTPDWTSHEVHLPAAALRLGPNDLQCRWPASPRDSDQADTALSRLGIGPENLHLVRLARLRINAGRGSE